jgi:hypothetical protein
MGTFRHSGIIYDRMIIAFSRATGLLGKWEEILA